MSPFETRQRADDVQFLRELLVRVQRRVDPHAFHFVVWGALVGLWFPLSTWFLSHGEGPAANIVAVVSFTLGSTVSIVLERRLKGRTRVAGEDADVGRKVGQVTAGNLVAAGVLNGLGPATGFIPGPYAPVLWGLAYASLSFHVGLLYSREFVWSGVFIFAGSCVSMTLAERCGYVLGPVMGLGMVVPGIVAERRTRRLRARDGRDAPPA